MFTGKTTKLVQALLNPSKVFGADIDRVEFCFEYEQKSYASLKKYWKDRIRFHKGIPDDYMEAFGLRGRTGESKPLLMVWDDVFSTIVSRKELLEFATGGCHHLNIILIIVTQFLFGDSPNYRLFQKQISHMLLFPTFRNRVAVDTLSRQVFGKQKLLKAVADEIDPFCPIFLDFKPATPDYLRIRNGFSLLEMNPCIFVEKKI